MQQLTVMILVTVLRDKVKATGATRALAHSGQRALPDPRGGNDHYLPRKGPAYIDGYFDLIEMSDKDIALVLPVIRDMATKDFVDMGILLDTLINVTTLMRQDRIPVGVPSPVSSSSSSSATKKSTAADGWFPVESPRGAPAAATRAPPQRDITDLFKAARLGPPASLESLARCGFDINTTQKGWTPLHSAALAGNKETLRTLIGLGAQVKKQLPDGSTVLHILAQDDARVDCARLLLEGRHGIKVNGKDNAGNSALFIAAENDNAEMCKLLLEFGAQADLKSNDGDTALERALFYACSNASAVLKK